MSMAAAMKILPFFIAAMKILPFFIAAVVSSSTISLDSFYSHHYLLDPKATNDSFSAIPAAVTSTLSTTAAAAVSALLSVDVAISVNVKLVGPFPDSSSHTLLSFISSLVSSDHFHLISSDHPLSPTHSLHVDVSPSPLSSTLSAVIAAEIHRTPASLRSPLHSISYSAVDAAVRDDFRKESSLHGVYIYLINFGPQAKPYAYSYSSDDPSPAYTRCLGTSWTSGERYIWIDLSAGPVDLCPTISGDCAFFPVYSAVHGGDKSQKALLADMASLVYSAYRSLLVPPMRIPVHFDSSLVVQFIHVHSSGRPDSHGLDWSLIEKTLLEGEEDGRILLGEQKLEFQTYNIDFNECAICSFAISRSMNSYTSRFLFDNFTLIVSEYLDSKKLHQVLVDSMDEFRKVGGFKGEDPAHVVPVFVFDLDYTNVLLLDRVHQSVAFRDMVVAIRTRNTQTVGEYRCNSRHMFVQTREMERPIVGSILQTMWGVAPTHLAWSSKGTRMDYRWSMGQTPFGPFSDMLSLSFVQRDAARRNVLLTSLNYTITTAIDVMESMVAHGGEKAMMKKPRRLEFEQRWNLLVYKVEKAISALSRLDFEMSLYFIRSSDHDLYTVHSMVFDSAEEMDASLVCFKDPPFPWGSFVFPGLGLLIILCVYSKRGKLFKNKRKQF